MNLDALYSELTLKTKAKLALIVLNTFYAIGIALASAFAILKLAFGV